MTHESTISTKNTAVHVSVAVMLLLLGGMIYITFRTRQLVMFHVVDFMGLGDSVDTWRDMVKLSLPAWIVYSLPDALWSAAYVIIVDAVAGVKPILKISVASVIPLIGLGSELLQLVGCVPGTFDVMDIVAYSLPYMLYVMIVLLKNRKK